MGLLARAGFGFLTSPFLIFFLLFLVLTSQAGAVPSITSWSSSGGTTQNKDNNQDIMYLVSQADNLAFSVTADQPVSFEWQVNKSNQQVITSPSTSDIFNWTVPNEKGIWEIHLRCWNGANEETHQEWVVSTLTLSEAPEIFESFTDGKFEGARTDTDPWGRALQIWTLFAAYSTDIYPYDANKKFWWRPDDRSGQFRMMAIPSDIGYGTWKFKYRFSAGISSWNVEWRVFPLLFGVSNNFYSYASAFDAGTHRRLDGPDGAIGYREIPWRGSASNTSHGTKWHTATIIRTKDGYWYLWEDDKFMHDTFENQNRYPVPEKLGINLARVGPGYMWTEIDSIEVYRDKYFPPVREVKYGAYFEDMDTPSIYTTGTGIIIDGREVTLSEIAQKLNDSSKFTYDPVTKTAISYSNISIQPGAQLVINGATLKLNSSTPGERIIRVNNGSSVILDNATITSNNANHYRWHFTSAFHRDAIFGSETSDNGFAYWFKGRFEARNSKIDNCGFMYFSGPNTVVLENTNFTNMVEVTDGNMTTGISTLQETKKNIGNNISIGFRLKNPLYKFSIKNCSFNGKDLTTMKFLAGDVFGNTTIYNTEFNNFNIKAADMYEWIGYGTKYPLSCNLNLVNCKFRELIVQDNLKANSISPKYYLDVKVIDNTGPVPTASVTITNEVDDINYPAINLEEYKVQTSPIKEGLNTGDSGEVDPYYKNVYGNKISSTTTGLDGHTPLLSDIQKTLIITDYKQDQIGRTNFSYAITATKDEKTASMSGLNIDETWYRPNPNQPTKTVVLNIDTGSGYIVDTSTSIDINQDGVIDISDLRIVALHFGETTALPYPRYDVNTDGTVDILDLRQVAGGM